jgi:hypothetical protein
MLVALPGPSLATADSRTVKEDGAVGLNTASPQPGRLAKIRLEGSAEHMHSAALHQCLCISCVRPLRLSNKL